MKHPMLRGRAGAICSARYAPSCRALARCRTSSPTSLAEQQRPAPTSESVPAWRRLLLLLVTPGGGQLRAGLDASSMRPWNDVQMTSHVAFVPGIAIAAVQTPPLPELALLQVSRPSLPTATPQSSLT
jgi:hypothetical protein